MHSRAVGHARLAGWVLGLLLLAGPVLAQQGVDTRAAAQLDAARAMIDPDGGYRAAVEYARMIPLEVRAGRAQRAKDDLYLVRGLMLEDDAESADRYRHLLIKAYLEIGDTASARSELERIEKTHASTGNLKLQVIMQVLPVKGLDYARGLAREMFPRIMDRTGVYCRMCYALAQMGESDQALAFIHDAMDLVEIFQKLDAYRFIAIAEHERGDQEGALLTLWEAGKLVDGYEVPTTRIKMRCDLAQCYIEMGEMDKARVCIQQATEELDAVDRESFQFESVKRDVVMQWARFGDADRALAMMAGLENEFARKSVADVLVDKQIQAGHYDEARGLAVKYQARRESEVDLAIARARLGRGELQLVQYLMVNSEFSSDRDGILRDIAVAYQRGGRAADFQAWVGRLVEKEERFEAHFAAAEYMLDAQKK